MITLDYYATAQSLSRVDLVIIDAEGADFEILKGAANILARFRPLVIAEVDHLATFGGSEQEMVSFMSDLSYSVRVIQCEFSRDLFFSPARCDDLNSRIIDDRCVA